MNSILEYELQIYLANMLILILMFVTKSKNALMLSLVYSSLLVTILLNGLSKGF